LDTKVLENFKVLETQSLTQSFGHP